jgi:large subunit ribosomal protein L18
MSDIAKKRIVSRKARHARIRKRVSGTSEQPRLCIRRTINNIVGQLIDDVTSQSILQLSTSSKSFQTQYGQLNKTEQSQKLGSLIAENAKEKGIEAVVFDRGGYIYHGRVKAFADGARESGLKF